MQSILRDLRNRHVKKHHADEVQIQETASQHPLPNSSLEPEILPITEEQAVQDDIYISPLQDSIGFMLIPQYIATYFEKFHPTFPFLHKPTFDITSTQIPLLQAVACLGAVYDAPENDYAVSKTFFKSGYEFLSAYVERDTSRFKELWVSQALLLFQYFAMYSCNDGLFLFAQKIHRRLVDGTRSASMLQPSHTEERLNESMSGQIPTSVHEQWNNFIAIESRSRIVHSMYYMDSQMAVTCNIKPILSAMEIKYELPCREHFWSALSPETWNSLRQEELSSFSEEDDSNGNSEPRPGQGLLYESMMHLIHRGHRDQQLKILWYSPFAALILVAQIQMMAREVISASIFLYSNIGNEKNRHNLTMLTEEHRGPILQALMNLADLIPKRQSINVSCTKEYASNRSLWHSVWIAWHYTALCLTHQDALLTTGIVECNIPAAISTHWELGKPRAKGHRDIYDDQDVFRIVDNLGQVLREMNTPPLSINSSQCLEDPFTTILGFKTFMIGWRVVRLMMLNISHSESRETRRKQHAGLYEAPTQSVLMSIVRSIESKNGYGEGSDESGDVGVEKESENAELKYLEWADRTFEKRRVWPIGGWMATVLMEEGMGTT
ncbi:hypothetical protein ACEPPN_005196 [Leptodophora sp. 'Broadleaf-Isolate-01']